MIHNALRATAILSVSLLVGIQSAHADDGNNAYQAFLAGLATMTSSSSAVVQNERNAGRLLKIRQAVTAKLLNELNSPPAAAPVGSTDSANGFLASEDEIDGKNLLCSFRWDKITLVPQLSPRDDKAAIVVNHLTTLVDQNYLASVLSALRSLTPPKPATDVPGAVRQLFNNYQVKVGAALQSKDDKDTRENVRKVCEADLAESDKAYYGQAISFLHPAIAGEAAPAAAAAAIGLPSFSFLGPIGSAFDVIAGIVGPLFIDFSNMVATEEQKQEVAKFLTANEHTLDVDGQALGRTTSDYLFAQRLSLAGQFAEQIAALRAVHVDLAKTDTCKGKVADMAARSNDGAPSAAFTLCYGAVWSQYSKLVDDTLKTASSYDQLADAGDTNTALRSYIKILNNYPAVIQWSAGSDDLWASVNQLITFAGAIANATSVSNITAIKKAVDEVK
jgi:hypothetical protein